MPLRNLESHFCIGHVLFSKSNFSYLLLRFCEDSELFDIIFILINIHVLVVVNECLTVHRRMSVWNVGGTVSTSRHWSVGSRKFIVVYIGLHIVYMLHVECMCRQRWSWPECKFDPATRHRNTIAYMDTFYHLGVFFCYILFIHQAWAVIQRRSHYLLPIILNEFVQNSSTVYVRRNSFEKIRM